MAVRIDIRRLDLLPALLLGTGLLGTGLGIAGTAQARHKEHSVYGAIPGYEAILDRNSDEYRSADAFCQTDASINAATNGAATAMSGGGGGSGNQFKRLKTQYATCMESRGAWIRITGNAAGDHPDGGD